MSGETTKRTDVLGIASFGLFLILVGVILAVTPNFLSMVLAFFSDFELQELAPNIYFPAPRSSHKALYTVISHFCFAFATLHIPILVARFILKDPIEKKAEAISGIIFWFGVALTLNQLIEGIGWFVFLGYLITLVGITIVIKNAVILIV